MTLVGLGREGTSGKGSVLEQGEGAVGEAPPEPKDATADRTAVLCAAAALSPGPTWSASALRRPPPAHAQKHRPCPE